MGTDTTKRKAATNPPPLYTRDYYLTDCDGHVEYKNSKGKVLGKRLSRLSSLARTTGHPRILDVGCGRGELILHEAKKGNQAFGIDTSPAAVDISMRTLSFWARDIPTIRACAHFLRADGCRLPFKADRFDVVILSDMLEHLMPTQQKSVLAEARRIMKRTGKLVIHTSPQKYFIPCAGRLYSVISRILKWFFDNGKGESATIPWNIRPLLPRGLQKDIHIGELSGYRLGRLLGLAGFRHKQIWLEPNPHYIDYLFQDRRALKILKRLHSIVPIDHLFYSELYAVAEPDRRTETVCESKLHMI